MIPAPVGAVVPLVPFGCRVVFVGGTMYYTLYDTYYRRVPDGYIVVADPRVAATTTDAVPADDETQTHTVWITNPNGSRIPVELRERDGGQWVGPAGEYYDAFPTEAQLQSVYGLGESQPIQVAAQPAPEDEAPSAIVWITNPNSSKTPVVLAAGEQGTWIGAYGEVYEALPTEEQLRPVYGLPGQPPKPEEPRPEVP